MAGDRLGTLRKLTSRIPAVHIQPVKTIPPQDKPIFRDAQKVNRVDRTLVDPQQVPRGCIQCKNGGCVLRSHEHRSSGHEARSQIPIPVKLIPIRVVPLQSDARVGRQPLKITVSRSQCRDRPEIRVEVQSAFIERQKVCVTS